MEQEKQTEDIVLRLNPPHTKNAYFIKVANKKQEKIHFSTRLNIHPQDWKRSDSRILHLQNEMPRSALRCLLVRSLQPHLNHGLKPTQHCAKPPPYFLPLALMTCLDVKCLSRLCKPTHPIFFKGEKGIGAENMYLQKHFHFQLKAKPFTATEGRKGILFFLIKENNQNF